MLLTLSGASVTNGAISVTGVNGTGNAAGGDGGLLMVGIGLQRGFKPQAVANCSILIANTLAEGNSGGGEAPCPVCAHYA
jgi:hypothetical protein